MSVHSTNQTIGQLKQRVRSLAKSPRNHSWFELSRELERLHRRDSTKFKDIIREGTLGYRTAYYLRDVGHLIRFAKLSKSEAERIGWTKLQIIGPWIDGRNSAELLGVARDNSVHEVKRRIAKKGRKKPHCVLLYFTTTQYDQFRAAMRRHGAEKARGGRSGRGLVGKEEVILQVLEQAPPAITR
jgi:hypothetical protein